MLDIGEWWQNGHVLGTVLVLPSRSWCSNYMLLFIYIYSSEQMYYFRVDTLKVCI